MSLESKSESNPSTAPKRKPAADPAAGTRLARHPGSRAAALLSALLLSACGGSDSGDRTLLNVSYDPTRELYAEFNQAFVEHWKNKTGETITIAQSHGGSGRQARAVIDGLRADVVTLALAADVDAIARSGLITDPDWQQRLDANSAPYQSTLAFLVRKGNPKNIRNWDDLIRPGVEVITPNPKTSGVARWNFLAAYGWALQTYDQDESKAADYISKLFGNVPVLDTAARGASSTFVERGIGDVLINWENELLLAIQGEGAGQFEIVVPSLSILAEPTVAVVDVNVERSGTRDLAEAYLEFLYSDKGQDLIGRHFYRPSNPDFLTKYQHQYPEIDLFTIDEVFGGWEEATKRFFEDGAVFDQIYLE